MPDFSGANAAYQAMGESLTALKTASDEHDASVTALVDATAARDAAAEQLRLADEAAEAALVNFLAELSGVGVAEGIVIDKNEAW